MRRVGILLAIIILMALALLGQRERARVLVQAKAEATQQADDLRLRFATMRGAILAMRTALQDNIKQSEQGKLQSPWLSQIKDYPDLGLFAAGAAGLKNPKQNGLVATLSGVGRFSALQPIIRNEVIAALNINSLFKSTAAFFPELKWVYYTSRENFIIISPRVDVKNHPFDKQFYQQAYWQDAAPGSNPQHHIVVTNPYQDAFGKGVMITMSAPIYTADKFRGVVSIDIGLDTIQKNLQKHTDRSLDFRLVGKNNAMIMDGNGRTGGLSRLPKQDFSTVPVDDSSLLTYRVIMPVSQGNVWLVSKLPTSRLLSKMLFSMFPGLLVLLAIFGLLLLIRELRHANKKITHISETDYLTGITNRRSFIALVEHILQRQSANNTAGESGFIMVDIDYFKAINDQFGHTTGDLVLQRVVNCMSQAIRNRDLLARIGGEEFALMLPESNQMNTRQRAERIRAQVQALEIPELAGKQISISLGVTNVVQGDTIERLLLRADKALYQAKDQGRNQLVFVKAEESTDAEPVGATT